MEGMIVNEDVDFARSREQKEDTYSQRGVDDLMRNDEIDAFEEAFMRGYVETLEE